jgi:hypothetical protein
MILIPSYYTKSIECGKKIGKELKENPYQFFIGIAKKIAIFIKENKTGILFIGFSTTSLCLTPKVFLVGVLLGYVSGALIDKILNPKLNFALMHLCYKVTPVRQYLTAEKAALSSISVLNSIIVSCSIQAPLINRIFPILGGIAFGYFSYQMCRKYYAHRNLMADNSETVE